MRTFATCMAFVILLNHASAQTKPKPLVSFTFHFADYRTPGTIKDSSFSKAFSGNDWYAPGKLSFGLGVSWWKQIAPKVDVSGNLSGTFSNFPKLFVKDDSIGNAGFTPQLEAMAHAFALKRTVMFNPFISAGLGAGMFGGEFSAYAPLGVGFKLRFKEGAYLINQIQYRKALTDGITQDYLYYNIGFAQTLGKQKTEEPVTTEPTPAIPPDRDGDGVEDSKDECPDVSGAVKGCVDSDGDGIADKDDPCPHEKGTLNGCADSDNDGAADKDDKCPDAKGTANGCPDADGDGIADKDDQCPTAKGTMNGCPDTDGDGINDADDKCPNDAGNATNNGCPEVKQEVIQKVNYAAKNIFFKFASDEILKQSFAPLDEVVKIMKENPSLKLSIAAHADNRGTPERNLYWSERRAQAVANYFISSGIDAGRLFAKGYGDIQPIADNKTEAGRAKNRRVEMKLEY
ncbi:MAG: OmpA family protein [Chitinophagaceae bacterium]|nr:OmpA family protein [Chitinophagaceae bacterium]